MAFTLMQVGGSLKSVNTDGGLSSALTLPGGVNLATNLQPRFARFKHYVVMVNSPTRPLSIGDDGTVRVLTPSPPSLAVGLSGVTSGALTGTYVALQTYKILDALGNIIAESDYGPAMVTAVAISAKKLRATFPVSTDSVSATQLYRTATNGGVYFPWALVDGNTAVTYEDDKSDAGLGLIAGPSLGSAPDLTLIAEHGGRLWGVDRDDVDDLRYTEAGTMYGWSALNTLSIPRIGADSVGITALIPRRAALGVTRRDTISQVTGSTRANITPTIVNGGEQVGCVSQESVVVFNDVAYFLARDGVYRWDQSGVTCITNGRVRSWFTSYDQFNLAMFWRAFACLDPVNMHYKLFLASSNSGVIDRWISMDLSTGAWFGPHKTAAFNPTCAFWVAGADQKPYFMVGSQEGFVSQTQTARNDWGTTPIVMDVITDNQTGDDEPQETYFGELTVLQKPQTVAGSLSVVAAVGPLDEEVVGVADSISTGVGRVRCSRVGVGESMTVEFLSTNVNEDVALIGYDVDPVNTVGKR